MEAFGEFIVFVTIFLVLLVSLVIFTAVLIATRSGKIQWASVEERYVRFIAPTAHISIVGYLLGNASLGGLSLFSILISYLRFSFGFVLVPLSVVLLLSALVQNRPWKSRAYAVVAESLPFLLWGILVLPNRH